jgi:hypothetical protein
LFQSPHSRLQALDLVRELLFNAHGANVFLAMDSSQLTTIAVTAVISVIAKEVFTWAVALFKTMVTAETTRARLKAIFSKTNLRIMSDLPAIATYTVIIAWMGWTDEPLSGKSFLIVMAAIVLNIVVIVDLLWNIAQALEAREATGK